MKTLLLFPTLKKIPGGALAAAMRDIKLPKEWPRMKSGMPLVPSSLFLALQCATTGRAKSSSRVVESCARSPVVRPWPRLSWPNAR